MFKRIPTQGRRRKVLLGLVLAAFVVVAYGGWQLVVWVGARPNDTWAYAPEVGWSDRSPVLAPSTRTVPALAYDPALDSAVLFGGRVRTAREGLSDTWLWDGHSWRQDRSAEHPHGLVAASMAYDPDRRGLLLFGSPLANAEFESGGPDTSRACRLRTSGRPGEHPGDLFMLALSNSWILP